MESHYVIWRKMMGTYKCRCCGTIHHSDAIDKYNIEMHCITRSEKKRYKGIDMGDTKTWYYCPKCKACLGIEDWRKEK